MRLLSTRDELAGIGGPAGPETLGVLQQVQDFERIKEVCKPAPEPFKEFIAHIPPPSG